MLIPLFKFAFLIPLDTSKGYNYYAGQKLIYSQLVYITVLFGGDLDSRVMTTYNTKSPGMLM